MHLICFYSLCSFYFNQEIIKSIHNLNTVEKVSKKATVHLGWDRRVGWPHLYLGPTERGLSIFLAAAMIGPRTGRPAGIGQGGNCLAA